MKIYKETELDVLVDILKNNGVISVPTDTVYGLCASINSDIAYNKLIRIKNRPFNKAFPIMCANELQIKNIAIVDEKVQKIIKKFMPGPITLILPKKENIMIHGIENTIAIRMATSKILEELIRKTGPLFMTSANKSGKEECKNIEEIKNKCKGIDGILEGKTLFNKASTIIDCTNSNIKVLREGPISLEQIENEIM